MRTLVVLCLLFVIVAWLSSPVYYFIIGPEVAKLPSHLRMSSGETELGCTAFAKDWNQAFPTSGAYCEQVPRWKHWSNVVRNIAYQIETYRFQKTVSVE
jgi:hypothetical protein